MILRTKKFIFEQVLHIITSICGKAVDWVFFFCIAYTELDVAWFIAAILAFDCDKSIAWAGLSAVNEIFEVHKAGTIRLDFYNLQGVFAAENI